MPSHAWHYGWRYADGCWAPAPEPEKHHEVTAPKQQLNIATWNVLFDSKDPSRPCSDRPEVLRHEERYGEVLAALQKLESHVIGLQEVTPFFLRKLLAEEWVRQHWFVSAVVPEEGSSADESSPAQKILTSQGSMLLSKIPFSSLQSHPEAEAVMGLLKVQFNSSSAEAVQTAHRTSVLVCSAHLKAFPYLMESLRAQQLAAICAQIENYPETWNHALVFGDFNFHREAESQNIPEKWAEFEGAKAVCTWSWSRNTMLQHYLPYFVWTSFVPTDWLEMRLDRMIYFSRQDASEDAGSSREAGKQRRCIAANSVVRLFGDEPVYKDKHNAEVLSWRELWGKHRKVPVEEYLFPSDHFGMLVNVEIQ